MKKTLFCLIAVGLIFTGCSRLIKIQTYDFDINETVTEDQVKDAILTGCEKRHWIAKEKAENTISAKLLTNGAHEVYVDIVYDVSNYKIVYVNSTNLNATGDKIHKAYAKWVTYLYKSINAELFKIN